MYKHSEAQHQRNSHWTLMGAQQGLKGSVFSLRLKDGNNGADVTSTGKVFHTVAAAMGNARLPIWCPLA